MGPPAAGKSSVAEPIAKRLKARVLDSDEAKKMLPGFDGGKNAGGVHRESSWINEDVMLPRTLDAGESFVWPTVGRKLESLRETLEMLAEEGYRVQLVINDMEHTTPPMKLTRQTLLQIVQQTAIGEAMRSNPFGFASEAVAIIKRKLADQLVEGIRYEPTGELYEMRESDLEAEVFERYLIPVDKSVQDHVRVDTSAEDITTSIEGRFVYELEKDEAVLLYVKLPAWFTVDTRVGLYNPDWAIVMEERDEFGSASDGSRLYLVAETKGENWKEGLRVDEQRKIHCGARHFGSKQMKQKGALKDVEYRVVSGLSELR